MIRDESGRAFNIDEIGFGGLRMMQDPEGFRYGTDAVLLGDMAAELAAYGGETRIMDLGTGTGIVPLILSHRTGSNHIYGVEIQDDACYLAEENVRINSLGDRITIIKGDVAEIHRGGAAGLEGVQGSFDAVTSNPPYTERNRGMLSGNEAKDMARHEIAGTLEDFMATAAWLLKDQGDFFMVHRPARIVDICCLGRRHNLEPRHMKFVSGKPGEAPNILLIHFVKNGGKELRILEPMAVRREDGAFTEEMMTAYL